MPRKATGGKPGRPFHPELLTPAEQRVLEGVREGLHNSEIGVRLGISPDGVKYHVSNMLAKLDLDSREELARWQPPREGALRRLWSAVPLVARWAAAGVAGVTVVGGVATYFLLDDSSSASGADYADGLISVSPSGEPGNGHSTTFGISGDGRYVVFQSAATNLVPGDNNRVDDIFLRDRQTGTTKRISMGMDGKEANGPSRDPVISEDGKHIAFVSVATNLVDVPAVTDDAALALLPADIRSVYSDPTRGRATLALIARANVYEYDVATGKVSLVSQSLDGSTGNLGSASPSISGDGRYVAFDSIGSNLVEGDTNGEAGGLESDLTFGGGTPGCDIFVRDVSEGRTVRVSVSSSGGQADGSSSTPTISADGSRVAFLTDAANLAPGDRNAIC